MTQGFDTLLGLIFFAAVIVAIITGIIAYLINSISLLMVLRTIGYPKAWLAFIPFAQDYLEGHVVSENMRVSESKGQMIKWLFLISCVISSVISPLLLKLINPNNLEFIALFAFIAFNVFSVCFFIALTVLRTIALYRMGYHVAIAVLVMLFLPNFWLFFANYKISQNLKSRKVCEEL